MPVHILTSYTTLLLESGMLVIESLMGQELMTVALTEAVKIVARPHEKLDLSRALIKLEQLV